MKLFSVAFHDIINNDERIKVDYAEDGTEFLEASSKLQLFPIGLQDDDVFVFYSEVDDDKVRHEFRLVRTNVKFVEAFKKALKKVKSASENQVPNRVETAPSSPSKSRPGYAGLLEDSKGVSSTRQVRLAWDGDHFWLHFTASKMKALPRQREGQKFMIQIPGGERFTIRFNETVVPAFVDAFDEAIEDCRLAAKPGNPSFAKRISASRSDSDEEEGENNQNRSQALLVASSSSSSKSKSKKKVVAIGRNNRDDDEPPKNSREIIDDGNGEDGDDANLGAQDETSSCSGSDDDDELENKARKRKSSKRRRRMPIHSFGLEKRHQMVERLKKCRGSPFFAKFAKTIRGGLSKKKSWTSVRKSTRRLLRSPAFQREFMFTFTLQMAGWYNSQERAQTLICAVVDDLLGPNNNGASFHSIVDFGKFEGRELWRDQAFEAKIQGALDLSGSHFG